MQIGHPATNRRDVLTGDVSVGLARGVAGLALVAFVAGTAAVASKASAQTAKSVIVDIGECVGIESPETRFQCYERAAEGATQRRPTPPSEPPLPDEQPLPSAQSPVDVDSQTTNPAGREPPSTESRASERPDEIRSVITELRETLPSTYLISLENGQVWRQTHARTYRMRPGMAIRIYPTRGSAYRLSAAELNGFIQVERVR